MDSATGGTAPPLLTAPPARGGLRERLGGPAAGESLTGLLFISPWILGFLAFSAIPMAASLVLSLTDFDPRRADEIRFVGLENYARMVSDPALIKASLVTLRFALIVVPVTLAFALGIAMLVNSTLLAGRNIFRTAFYMPLQIPIVASTVVWIGVMNVSNGWLDIGLQAVGLPAIDWLNSPFWVHPALALMGLWGIGNLMLIFLAGLQSVPTELYDAAKVDGAGHWSTFRQITLPMISPVLFYNLIIVLIATFQYFTQAYVITNGRGDPGGETLFFNLNLFREAFQFYNMGYASALAWLLFAVVLGLTILLFRTAGRWVYEGAER
ncbi:MAG TPA: sugar ABC transporter permease [Candidatus Limnocylindria bacterium]|jgi:multiple sugar transport system permease protein|nr:sugar ABC transporter permease [Candidatus Limnocylindria bacterium]